MDCRGVDQGRPDLPPYRPMGQCRQAGADAAVGQSDPQEPLRAGWPGSGRIFGARVAIGIPDRGRQSWHSAARGNAAVAT